MKELQLLTAVLLCLAFLPITATAWDVTTTLKWLGSVVNGSGKPAVQNRDVAPFNGIDLCDSTDVEVRIGGPMTVIVEADDNLLSLIGTEVKDGILVIKSTGSYRSHGSPKVIVSTPALDRLSINGSGDAKLSRVSGDALKLTIAGSGDIEAQGSVERLSVNINGSGDADLLALDARSAFVVINGSGDARLNVSDSLDAVVNGSGDISYRGDPAQVSRTVHGSGDVSRR